MNMQEGIVSSEALRHKFKRPRPNTSKPENAANIIPLRDVPKSLRKETQKIAEIEATTNARTPVEAEINPVSALRRMIRLPSRYRD